MNKMCILAIVSISFFLASTALAQNEAATATVSPYVGGYTFDGGQNLDTSLISGVRVGYNFTRRVGAEILFGAMEPDSELPSSGNTDAYRYGGDMLYHFMPDSKLVPFAAAGLGGLTIDYPSGTKDQTHPYVNYGGGLMYFLVDWLALRGDLRHIIVFDGGHSNFEYTAGVTFQFGAPAKAVAPAKKEYCVTLNIEFEFDKAIIRSEYNDEVAKVGNFMKKYPTTTAVIEGHTDEVGTAEYNIELSKRRADSVVNHLVDNYGIERSRLSVKAYGLTRPKVPNAPEDKRHLNRRIEAIIDCPAGVTPP